MIAFVLRGEQPLYEGLAVLSTLALVVKAKDEVRRYRWKSDDDVQRRFEDLELWKCQPIQIVRASHPWKMDILNVAWRRHVAKAPQLRKRIDFCEPPQFDQRIDAATDVEVDQGSGARV